MQAYLEYLTPMISDNKQGLFEKVLSDRTKFLTVVLEDIFQPHNASAVVRSCDCFGVQDLHIIENRYEYSPNPDVTLGSAQWVDMHRYNYVDTDNTVDCLRTLKRQGYKVVATSPHENDQFIGDFEVDSKIALVFGTEKDGISDTVRQEADAFVKIPMYGFTESYNISVSVALCLYEFIEKIRKSKHDWTLSESEVLDIKLRWSQSVIRNEEIHWKKFFPEIKKST